MEMTGIIRRVDNLGRIVIPKEIRRELKIKAGENLELKVENENIILKKFSYLSALKVSSQILCTITNLITHQNLYITSNEIIIASSDIKYINKKISKKIEEIIINIENIEKNKKIAFDKKEYLLEPIISYGDIYGLVIMESTNQKNFIILKLIAMYLSQELEQY